MQVQRPARFFWVADNYAATALIERAFYGLFLMTAGSRNLCDFHAEASIHRP